MKHTSSVHPKYRPDIDGLRAIAVLSVVSFHAFPELIPGGFIGVDIFFVISGYLISTIILGNLQANSFSFLEFYSRRVKRIFPALLLVLFATYLIGWNFLFPREFQLLNKNLIGGVAFISNFVLWKDAGYFDTLSDTKPLLHLWSLGIEEQFYIFWPFVLWVASKWKFKFSYICVAIGAVSFFLNIVEIEKDPTGTFYSPLTRFWELLIGSTLAIVSLNKSQKINKEGELNVDTLLSFLGAIVILLGLIFTTKEKTFPGYWALLPTIGAALIIYSKNQAWVNQKILSNKILVWFGLISFPLYLWHWPILSFLRIILGESPSLQIRLIAVLISIVFAWITLHLIEKPVRSSKSGGVITVVLLLFMITLGCIGAYSYDKERNLVVFSVGSGMNRAFNRLNPLSLSGADGGDLGFVLNDCGIENEREKKLFGNCQRDSRGKERFALLGDSKAASLFPGLVRTSTNDGRWLFIGGNGSNGAPIPLVSKKEKYASFQKITEIAIDSIQRNENIDTVVIVAATRALFQLNNEYSIEDLPLSSNYDSVLEGFSNVINRFLKANKNIVLVVDNPTFADPSVCLNRVTQFEFINSYLNKNKKYCQISISDQIKLTEKYRFLLNRLQSIEPNKIKVFDTLDILCDGKTQLCTTEKNGRLLYSYSDHISDFGAGLVGQQLNQFLMLNYK